MKNLITLLAIGAAIALGIQDLRLHKQNAALKAEIVAKDKLCDDYSRWLRALASKEMSFTNGPTPVIECDATIDSPGTESITQSK